MKVPVLVLTAVLLRRHQPDSWMLLLLQKKKMLKKTCNLIEEGCKVVMFYVFLKWIVTLGCHSWFSVVANIQTKSRKKDLCRNWHMLFFLFEETCVLDRD